jgi:hypothetical protein
MYLFFVVVVFIPFGCADLDTPVCVFPVCFVLRPILHHCSLFSQQSMVSAPISISTHSSGFDLSSILSTKPVWSVSELAAPSESAFQLYRRSNATPILTGLGQFDDFVHDFRRMCVSASSSSKVTDAPWGLNPMDVVEIYGRSGSGKSEMLYTIMLCCGLPTEYAGIPIGGQQVGVVVIDLDYRISVVRLLLLLDAHVRNLYERTAKEETASWTFPTASGFIESAEYDVMLSEFLERIHLVHCQTPSELLVAIRQAGKIARESSRANGSGSVTRMLLIDNLASFFWQSKCTQGAPTGSATFYDGLIDLLNRTIVQYRFCLVATKPLLFNKQVADLESDFRHREYLHAWGRMVSFRILLRHQRSSHYSARFVVAGKARKLLPANVAISESIRIGKLWPFVISNGHGICEESLSV